MSVYTEERLKIKINNLQSDNARLREQLISAGGALDECIATNHFLEKEIDQLKAQCAIMREALEKLAKLGAEPYYGNSIGNQIAQQALSALKAGEPNGKDNRPDQG